MLQTSVGLLRDLGCDSEKGLGLQQIRKLLTSVNYVLSA